MKRMNKMKKFYLIIAAITLCGCATNNLEPQNQAPSEKDLLCRELKRNIIFSSTSMPNISPGNAAQKAHMMRLYDKYKCSRFEKK